MNRIFRAILLGFLILVNFWVTNTSFAETNMIHAVGTYSAGDDPNLNFATAKERARSEAKRVAAEKAGVYVESYSKTENYVLTQDEVRVIAANVMKILDEKLTIQTVNDNVIIFTCTIDAEVNTDNIDLKSLMEQRKEKDKETEELLKKVFVLEQENSSLKDENERYRSDNLNLSNSLRDASVNQNATESKEVPLKINSSPKYNMHTKRNESNNLLTNSTQNLIANFVYGICDVAYISYKDATEGLCSELKSMVTTKAYEELRKSCQDKLGYMIGWKFRALEHFKDGDRIVYLGKYSKEENVAIIFVLNTKGEIINFNLNPMKAVKKNENDENENMTNDDNEEINLDYKLADVLKKDSKSSEIFAQGINGDTSISYNRASEILVPVLKLKVTESAYNDLKKNVRNKLGYCKEYQFRAFEHFKDGDRVIYIGRYSKEETVAMVFTFNPEGKILNFNFAPVKKK